MALRSSLFKKPPLRQDGLKYSVIRSGRKTIGIEIRDGEVLVRAPYRASDRAIREMLRKHDAWIRKRIAEQERRALDAEAEGLLTEREIGELKEQARTYIPQRVAVYAPLVGAAPGRITIRAQKTRWGSCSSKGNLNFNCLLMLTPPEVIDSVVVHELCHMKEMNHSKRFYEEVRRVFPDYDRWNRWLKRNGGTILQRVRRSGS